MEQLPDNRWKFSLLKAPDAAWVASRPHEVTQAIRSAFTEAQIAAYADWRNTVYDGAVVGYKRHRPTARSRKRCDVYSADMWKRDPNDPAIWISPKGLRFPEGRQVVQRVIDQLERDGVPVERTTPKAQARPSATVTSMTARTTPMTQRRGKTA